MNELSERLARLWPLAHKARAEFDADAYLCDIVERNLEVAAQCCLDICQRIIALEGGRKAVDYHDAIVRMGEMGVLLPDFAQRLAPLAGFRNILVHGYLVIDWDQVYRSLQRLAELEQFSDQVRAWLRDRPAA